MANEEQMAILKQGVEVWNKWRDKNPSVDIDLTKAELVGDRLGAANLRAANLRAANLGAANLGAADLRAANLGEANLGEADLEEANLSRAILSEADLREADLVGANLGEADLSRADLRAANLSRADLRAAYLYRANLGEAYLTESNMSAAMINGTVFVNSDLSKTLGLGSVAHHGPSHISTDTFVLSKGQVPEAFLRGCGLSDWEVEAVKLYNPDLSNEEINNLQYRIYELRATQALQISSLFVSYSHADSEFVDKIGDDLTEKGIRYWRDTHDAKAGRLEKQIDRAIRQHPTVLLVLSEHSLSSDWVEHEVKEARKLEKELERDVLCPVALDGSWKSSRWPKRIMEQIMEYNILDFSAWKEDSKFDGTFRKLLNGLELFYKA